MTIDDAPPGTADQVAATNFYLLRQYVHQEAGPNSKALQDSVANMRAFQQSFSDLRLRVTKQLAAVQTWQGAAKGAFDDDIDERLAALQQLPNALDDAITAVDHLLATIGETAQKVDDLEEPHPAHTASVAGYETLEPGVTAQDADERIIGLVNGMAPDYYRAAQALRVVAQIRWGADQSAPSATSPDGAPKTPSSEPPRAGGGGQAKPGANSPTDSPGGTPSGAGANTPSGDSPAAPTAGPSGDAANPSSPDPTLAGTPTPDPPQQPPIDSTNPPTAPPTPGPTPPITPVPIPPPTKEAPSKEPKFTEPKLTAPKLTDSSPQLANSKLSTPKFGSPSSPEPTTNPPRTATAPTQITTGAPGSTTEPGLAGTAPATDVPQTRGGYPYMPPMGGMGAQQQKSASGIKPGVADHVGGPDPFGRPDPEREYAGVPDELRGRSADRRSTPRRRKGKTTMQRPDDILDEHLWNVES